MDTALRESCIVILLTITTAVLGQGDQTFDPCSVSLDGGVYEFFLENIMENVPVESELGILPVKGDETEIISMTPDDHEWLRFEESSRAIILKKALSVDKGAPRIPKWVIYCLPNATNARAIPISITILVLDYNNHAPTFNGIYHNTTVSEDTNVGAVIYSGATATDDDKPYDRNSQVIYSIVPGNFSDYFRLESSTDSVILLKKKLDYEKVKQMIIELKAMDRAQQPETKSSTATITVNVEDYDDLNPEFTSKTYFGSIPEDASAGTFVSLQQRIHAEDKDSMNVSVKYRLLDPYGMFDINEDSGQIRYIGPMYEGMRTVTVVVLAAQIDNPLREGFAILTITITEANINAPKFTQNIYYVTKSELEPNGSIIVQTSATDPDFGTVLKYSLVDNPKDLSIDQEGNIKLLQPLDYEVEQHRTIYVTATDESHTATATVELTIADVNDNDPVMTIRPPVVNVNREQGLIIARVTAEDADINNVLSFTLGSHQNLFQISPDGEISINATAEDLPDAKYPVLVRVWDNGEVPRHASDLLVVNFPDLGVERTTSPGVRTAGLSVEEDNLMAIVLGAVAGALAVIILILIVYIVWRNRRTKEELDKARAPQGFSAKGLTYRQAEAPDDLPKMDMNYTGETDDSEFGGSTTIQENPLRSTAVNEAYLQSSGSEMDRDVGEIEIETSVVPYDEDFGYPTGRVPYMNTTTRGAEDATSTESSQSDRMHRLRAEDATSTESSQSDSTGGSRRVLVNDIKQNSNKMTSWDSDDKIHPQGSQKLLDTVTVTTPSKTKKEKPEITVYF